MLGSLACNRNGEQQPPITEESQHRLPDQESWNATLVTSNLGSISAEIWFGHMSKFNDRDEYEFDQNLRVDFFNKNGKHSSRITATNGMLNESRKFMEVFGKVVAHSDSANLTLYTERLQWDENRRKIRSNEEVTITTEQDTVYGVGFESDPDLTHWNIFKPRGHSSRPLDLNIDRQFERKPKSGQ